MHERSEPRARGWAWVRFELLPETQIFDERLVSLQSSLLEGLKEPAAAPNHPEEAMAAVMIPFVLLEVGP